MQTKNEKLLKIIDTLSDVANTNHYFDKKDVEELLFKFIEMVVELNKEHNGKNN